MRWLIGLAAFFLFYLFCVKQSPIATFAVVKEMF